MRYLSSWPICARCQSPQAHTVTMLFGSVLCWACYQVLARRIWG